MNASLNVALGVKAPNGRSQGGIVRNLVVLGVKANAHYTCQECGSTELIQAHHEIPGDDSSLVVLCAECHSKRHPSLPKALFFNKSIQPYWHNKSASSLAKEIDVHPRTVIRVAKRLEILPGELSPWDEELIRNNIPKLIIKPKCPKCGSGQVYYRRILGQFVCRRCGHIWELGRGSEVGIGTAT